MSFGGNSSTIMLVGFALFANVALVMCAFLLFRITDKTTAPPPPPPTTTKQRRNTTPVTETEPKPSPTGTKNYGGDYECQKQGKKYNPDTGECYGEYKPPTGPGNLQLPAGCENIPEDHKQTFCCNRCPETRDDGQHGHYPNCGENGRQTDEQKQQCCASIAICDTFPSPEGFKYYNPDSKKCEYSWGMDGYDPKCYGGTGGRLSGGGDGKPGGGGSGRY